MTDEPKLNNVQDHEKNTLYTQIGGRETCHRLSALFHVRIANDPVLKEIFPKNLTHLSEWFALFLTEQFGGPADYTAKRGKKSLGCRHAHLSIGDVEAESWLGQLFAAMDEIALTAPARERLRDYFIATARTLSDPFLPFYHLPLDELRAILEQKPTLATDSDRGHSLLSEAASRWDLPRVQMLLEYNADVNVVDRLGHDPLYQATRVVIPASEAEGCAVVALLIRHGAQVNRQSGPGKSTPLHMAARRGHIAIAEVLLAAGAEIEKKDANGDTPLRRAVNCGQKDVVLLLLSRGADPLSRNKQGRTALDAARQQPIRQALQEAT